MRLVGDKMGIVLAILKAFETIIAPNLNLKSPADSHICWNLYKRESPLDSWNAFNQILFLQTYESAGLLKLRSKSFKLKISDVQYKLKMSLKFTNHTPQYKYPFSVVNTF